MRCCPGCLQGGGAIVSAGEAGCAACPASRENQKADTLNKTIRLSGPAFRGEMREEKPLKRISCSKIVKALKIRG